MAKKIEIFIRQEGQVGPILHETHDGATVAALKADLAGDNNDAEYLLFEEDADEPLKDHHQVRDHGDGTKVLHRTRCSRVQVTVRYAGRTLSDDLGPGSTLDRIKRWAERKLGIDDTDAAEMSLQIAGTTDRPDGSTHVGSLITSPGCSVTFDLLPTERVNGGR